MKRIFGAALLSLSCAVVSAQVPGEEPFHGGSADGHALAENVIPIGPSLAFAPYFGGSGDGYSAVEDGATLPPSLSFSPYIGGSGDGYDGDDDAANITFPPSVAFGPFVGGSGDGYDSEDDPANAILPPAVAFGPFFGGAADGYAGYLIPSVIVLPVELLSFEGRAMDGSHLLWWKVATEAAVASYVLERCGDGRSFAPLGTVAAKAGSGLQEHSHTDAHPLDGKNFYRLRMVRADGAYDYSGTVLLIREADGGPVLSLAPNPATATLRLRYSGVPEGAALRILDARGVVVYQQALAAGTNSADLPVSAWMPGTYMAHLSGGGWSEVIRFVKQ